MTTLGQYEEKERYKISGGLYLEHKGLINFPDIPSDYTQLKILHLFNNQLTSLPDSLGQLTQLKTLNLSGNQLTSLPDSLGQLTQLQTLYLSGNQLTSLPDSLGQLTQLKTLRILGNKLTSLPSSLGQLTQLIELDLEKNRLISLPGSLGQLTQLIELYLGGNQLTSLPDSLGQLSQLKIFRPENNKLTSLPDSLGQLTQLIGFNLENNQLTSLPDSLGQLIYLKTLDLRNNQLTSLPDSLGQLTRLTRLDLENNQLTSLPDSLGQLSQLKTLNLSSNLFTNIPDSLGQLTQLQILYLRSNKLTNLPDSLGQLTQLIELHLSNNPLFPEWAIVYEEGTKELLSYLRAKKTPLYEAKLVLVGEGEVGKSCLLSALRGEPFQHNQPTTHGIEVKSVLVIDPATGHEQTLNAWDFGGQPVYRPTHQLFFSAPALYLIVWKPRQGPQQGAVEDWIRMVKYRAPEAGVLVVATHGGPGQRLPDLDEHGLRSRFGAKTVLGFHVVDSETGHGIAELMVHLGELAAALPEMGRRVPTRWQQARQALLGTNKPYLRLPDVLELCQREAGLSRAEAERFVNVDHELGQLVHYQHDIGLRDVVILKPDWLTKALSFVLDDLHTRHQHGLVTFARLQTLWHDSQRPLEERYPLEVHPIFLRLMERYELSYRIADAGDGSLETSTSLVAQLVPDTAPLLTPWTTYQQLAQQTRRCRVIELEGGQSATAEGLFYRLLVRLHRYSLGREKYSASVHWQRGLVLDADYNGRALLEQVGNDIIITVKAAYPDTLLDNLTSEVKWLVEFFWKGLRCQVTVPCLSDVCPRQAVRPEVGPGWIDLEKLVNFHSKRPLLLDYQCPETGCEEFLSINELLNHVTPLPPKADPQLANLVEQVKIVVEAVSTPGTGLLGRFDHLTDQLKVLASQADANFNNMLMAFDDEARDVPRLFSLSPVERNIWDWPKGALSRKFHLTLWCEHARLPLPLINDAANALQGVYELELPRIWLVKAAPFLKILFTTLGAVLPVASAGAQIAGILNPGAQTTLANQLELAEKSMDLMGKSSDMLGSWSDKQQQLLTEAKPDDISNSVAWFTEQTLAIRTDNSTPNDQSILRVIQQYLQKNHPDFGSLLPVRDAQRRRRWVHPRYVHLY
jgi:Leucine-rich repeat (LRR) protein